MAIDTGICPICKKEIDLKASNLDPEDVWGPEDAYVLVEHNDDKDQVCPGSNEHTQQLLDKDYGEDDLTIAADLEDMDPELNPPRDDWIDP